MILCDTGPLVALIDRGDRHHLACRTVLEGLGDELLLTTWPCLTEAMYLFGRVKQAGAHDAVWSLIAQGSIRLDVPAPGEWSRLQELMRHYRDLPMDLADASLVAAGERLGVRRVFTLDSHFRVYRFNDVDWFDVIP